jgi:hypothetical protein
MYIEDPGVEVKNQLVVAKRIRNIASDSKHPSNTVLAPVPIKPLRKRKNS